MTPPLVAYTDPRLLTKCASINFIFFGGTLFADQHIRPIARRRVPLTAEASLCELGIGRLGQENEAQ